MWHLCRMHTARKSDKGSGRELTSSSLMLVSEHEDEDDPPLLVVSELEDDPPLLLLSELEDAADAQPKASSTAGTGSGDSLDSTTGGGRFSHHQETENHYEQYD